MHQPIKSAVVRFDFTSGILDGRLVCDVHGQNADVLDVRLPALVSVFPSRGDYRPIVFSETPDDSEADAPDAPVTQATRVMGTASRRAMRRQQDVLPSDHAVGHRGLARTPSSPG